jgi:hypothetical protein
MQSSKNVIGTVEIKSFLTIFFSSSELYFSHNEVYYLAVVILTRLSLDDTGIGV